MRVCDWSNKTKMFYRASRGDLQGTKFARQTSMIGLVRSRSASTLPLISVGQSLFLKFRPRQSTSCSAVCFKSTKIEPTAATQTLVLEKSQDPNFDVAQKHMVRKLVVVGGVAGGASCAARARRLDENAKIVIYEKVVHERIHLMWPYSMLLWPLH
jgi:hypothetical protein